MKRPDRLAVGRVVATWWLPTVIACAVGALYVCYSVAQWRPLVVPSWDLGIFAEAVQAYSRFEAPIVPIKGPGYNLLGDSILIEIDASNHVQWKMENEREGTWKNIDLQGKNEIQLTICNTKQLILPATGGSGFGLVTMGGIALMAQAILMGTYFTLQCRKGDDKLRKKR